MRYITGFLDFLKIMFRFKLKHFQHFAIEEATFSKKALLLNEEFSYFPIKTFSK